MKIGLCEDGRAWNRAVAALDGSLYHSWEWGEIRQSQGWVPWRVLIEVSGEPRAALQILERRLPVLGRSLLYGPRGIAGNDRDPALVCALADWLRQFMRQRKAAVFRTDPAILDTDEERKSLLRSAGFQALPDEWSRWNLPRATMSIDLTPSKESLFRKLHKHRRQYVSKCARLGVRIVDANGEDDVRRFYKLVATMAGRKGFALRDVSHFLGLHRTFIAKGEGQLFLAIYQERPIAGLLLVKSGQRSYNLYNGSDPAYSNVHPNDALYWRAIEWSKEQGCREWDLIGVATAYPPKQGNSGYGLYLFKSQFGAQLRYSAGYFDLFIHPAAYRLFRTMERNTRGRLFGAALKLRSLLQRAPRS